jgi:hypothetical protein
MANTFIFDDDNQPDAGGPIADPGGEPPDESESGNRNAFMIIAVGIGGLILLSLICMVIYLFVFNPQQKAAQATQQANAGATQTQSFAFQQQTQEAALFTPTLPPTPVFTDTATTTPVVVFATETPAGSVTEDPATATVEALQTQLVSAQLTATFQVTPTGATPTTTKLAQTGFADEVGLPSLFVAALLLVGVILLARRLRAVPTR